MEGPRDAPGPAVAGGRHIELHRQRRPQLRPGGAAKFDYYTGINVVSFVKLLEHLKAATGDQPVDSKVDDVDDLATVVRFAARTRSHSAGLAPARMASGRRRRSASWSW